MRMFYRYFGDRFFTVSCYFSAVLLTAALLIVLAPMLLKGFSAVVFKGTVEFRKMQHAMHGRGDAEAIDSELQSCMEVRNEVYRMLDEFKVGIDTSGLADRVRLVYRDYGKELRNGGVEGEEYSELRGAAKEIRNKLLDVFESTDKQVVLGGLDSICEPGEDEKFKGAVAYELFEIAADYRSSVKDLDLGRRDKYIASLEIVQESVKRLFGPRPGEATPALSMEQYGSTRWDMAERELDKLLYGEKWIQQSAGAPLKKQVYARVEDFEGTKLAPLFGYIEKNLDKALNPRVTIYWQYFIDDSTPGHYFGGVGPEILGTLLLTLMAIVFAFPIGVTAAAYLVECAGDNIVVKIIRVCVNTLAGVPSIVFGLFGLAFFVLYLMPLMGAEPKGCILTASLTLAVLILPVIIRASEEAIRVVPQTYKEASLALGAGRFRTFMVVTLPAALPGILTGLILSLGRAAGETAPILFTGVVALGSVPKSVFDSTRALSYGSYDIAVGDRLAMMVPHQQFGMLMTLIALVLILNVSAIVLRWRITRKLHGG